MDSERFRKIEDIFQSALDLSGAERERFIRESAEGDADLISEVEKLVARYEREETFLESPVWTDSRFLQSKVKREIARSLDDEIEPNGNAKSFAGQRVGVYRLIEEIGRGGMGVVYHATRADGEFDQKVAVKLVKRGMDTDFILQRFRFERQILANLNHPNIARLLDGGTTQDGAPYFVMEFVEGAPVLKYCEAKKIGLREKLELFGQVCSAVAYAHRRRIIHRDIKPGNILVTDDGTPKLLDFGIAKILDPDSIHESIAPTATQMRLMTPEYASPEQARSEEVTAASDQYSLGVLLYELITGARPYKFSSRAPFEIARVICEEIPPEPSSGEFGRMITGDGDFAFDADFCQKLDRIVLKTLRKNPLERYASVEELAADINRFLRNETVLAESFAGAEEKIEFPPAPVKHQNAANVAATTNKTFDTNGTVAAQPSAGTISPRRRGVKRGLFLIILSFLSIPVFTALLVLTVIPPLLQFFVFIVLFIGGIVRIVYALLMEPSRELLLAQNKGNSSEAETVAQAFEPPPRRPPAALKYVFGAVAALIVGYGLYDIFSHTKIDLSATPSSRQWKNNFASAMNLKRLTTSGKARQAMVSPDGKNVVYISEDAARQSLWLQSVDAGEARLLVAPDAVFYTELSFSPDGNYVYYIVSRQPDRTLYRVSARGGAPEKISGNVLNLFALSPDGRRIVYDHQNSDNRQHSLFIAELDEESQIKSAQTLFVLDLPNYFPGGIAFSPDGGKIVYPRTTIETNKEVVNLFVYDLETKRNEKLGARDFNRINSTAWRAGGEEIVISASENDSAPHQLWLVAYPSGEVTRLTNDFTDYLGVSLTVDSSALTTTKISEVSNIWTSELGAASQNYVSKTKQITSGFDRQDGRNGVNWTKDERILYAGSAGAERNITLMNRDGANSRVILTGAANPSFPSLTGDNRYLVFADKKGQELNIWRFDMTNASLAQISSRYAVTPALAPDNRSVVYSTLSSASSSRLTVHRKPLDGGEETVLTESLSVRPAVSPDGRFLACNYAGDETNDAWQIAVLPFDSDDAAPRFIKPYANRFFRSPQERPLAWSPDGKFLYFLNTANNVTNIFRIAATGGAPPVQMTHFTSGELFDFALAPDGKSVALARGSVSSDIVIFKNSL